MRSVSLEMKLRVLALALFVAASSAFYATPALALSLMSEEQCLAQFGRPCDYSHLPPGLAGEATEAEAVPLTTVYTCFSQPALDENGNPLGPGHPIVVIGKKEAHDLERGGTWTCHKG